MRTHEKCTLPNAEFVAEVLKLLCFWRTKSALANYNIMHEVVTDRTNKHCTLCDKTFVILSGYRQHLRSKHDPNYEVPSFAWHKKLSLRQYLKKHFDLYHGKLKGQKFECNTPQSFTKLKASQLTS